jgi:hypothetical protein
MIVKRPDRSPRIRGRLRAYERPAGSRLWLPCYEAENVILNQWYQDLFGQLGPFGDRPAGMDVGFSDLQFGYQPSPTFAEADTALQFVWGDVFSKLGTATAAVPTTALDITPFPSPIEIASGATITVGAGLTLDTFVTSAAVNIGDTSIAVVSHTPHVQPIGTIVSYHDITAYVPQVAPINYGSPGFTGPEPNVTYSFFLPAAANAAPIKFTEAGLRYNPLYTGSVPSGAGRNLGSHVAFAYTKNGNTDLRIDYTLTRETD